MANSADLDQLASSEANWSGSTPFANAGQRVYPGSAGQGLSIWTPLLLIIFVQNTDPVYFTICPFV